MRHKLKIREQFADAIVSGEKTFEVRENDRGYQKGDIIEFVPYDDKGVKKIGHGLFLKDFEITYVLSGWGIENGCVVIGIREARDER